MMPFRKIIFPVDYSESCRAAVPYVSDVAHRFGAHLRLVHAYGSESLTFNEMVLANPTLPDEIAALETNLLREFAKKEFGQEVELCVRLGDPANVIHQMIREDPADLIMLPTHGRGLARRLLLGSVAAKVLHDLSAAVWTATPEALGRGQTAYKSVLCACDLGDAAERAAVIQAAAAMAARYGASLSLVNVVELAPQALEVDYSVFRGALIEAANLKLEELKKALGVDAPHRVVDGAVAAAIREEAVRTGADLIVAGRGHQQETVGRMWSSLYEIVREAPCPVLSV